MKILIFLEGYFPAIHYGGPPVSINNLCKLLPSTYEKYIVTCDHEKNSQKRFSDIKEGWNEKYDAKVLYLRYKQIKLIKFREVIKEINPDIIYLNSLFNIKYVIPVLKLSNEFKLPCILAPRGELYAKALKMKWFKKKPYLFLIKRLGFMSKVFFQATSFEERDQIKKFLGAREDKIIQLDNIPTLTNKIYEKNTKIKGELNCVFLSRIHPKKNLIFALKVLRELKGKIIYDIYGYIEDNKYWKEIQKEIELLPPNITVNYRGTVIRENIYMTLSKYDIFLFPTLGENYGQAIAEAMLSSCPIIISDETPWTNINEFGAGWAISLTDKYKYVSVLQDLVKMDNLNYLELVKKNNEYISQKLKLDELVKKYDETFKKIIN